MTRQCPFPGCTKRVPSDRFGCRPHWFSLTQPQRGTIVGAYNAWKSGAIDGQRLREIQEGVLAEVGAKR